MARSHRFAVAAAATLALNLAAHASLLQNPGLNAGPDSNTADFWTLIEPDITATGMPVDSASFQGFANHEAAGTRGLWFKSFAGNGNPATVSATLYQDVPAIAGQNYTVSAWFLAEPNYSGQNELFIEYFGAGDIFMGSVSLDVDALQTNDSTWRQFSVNAFAPAGTSFLRVGANMLDGMNAQMNPQSAFVDDFILIPAPGAACAFFSAIGLAGTRRRTR